MPVGEAVGVPVGEGEVGGVGVGVTPGQVPSTLYTMCMFGKPGSMPSVGVGSGNPQVCRAEIAWRRFRLTYSNR